MAKPNYRDPRGHSLRIYSDLYDSPAFASLSPHDVLAYLALLRDLKQYNNGDLSLPLTRAKKYGIKHHVTLARSLRALCAVGLIAVTRKGGCTKDGQRLPSLYRVTDRECFEIPAKHLPAQVATNEWKSVNSVAHGQQLIAAAERKATTASATKSEAIKAALGEREKTKALGHGVTATRTPRDTKSARTRTPRDTWAQNSCHGVSLAQMAENPITTRVSDRFEGDQDFQGHRTPRVPPIHSCHPLRAIGGSAATTGQADGTESADDPSDPIATLADLWRAAGHRSGWRQSTPSTGRLTKNPSNLFTGLLAA